MALPTRAELPDSGSRTLLQGLAVRFLVVMVPIFLILSVPGIWWLIDHELRADRDNLAVRIGGKAARVGSLLTRHRGVEDQRLAGDLLAVLSSDSAFLCAELKRRGESEPLATYPPPGRCTGAPTSHHLVVPVGMPAAADLVVRFSEAEIARASAEHRTLMILVVALSFLIAIFAAGIGFRLRVGRPLAAFLQSIRRSTELGVRTPMVYPGKDELSLVISAFNEMLGRDAEREQTLEETNAALLASEAELKRLNEDLERRIEERTIELRGREAALVTSEQRFRDFADASSDWYWEMDASLRFSFFSDRFTDVTGVPPEALLGKTREETGIPDVDPEQWRRHLAALHGHRPFRDFVHPRTKANGKRVWLSISGRPYFDSQGRFEGFRGVGSDITRLKEAEADLRRAKERAEASSKAKSEFLAKISHEIRTPMNGVLGMTDLLSSSDLSARQKQLVDAAHRSARNLLNLINDILDISKIETGRLSLDRDRFDLKAVIGDVVEMLYPAAQAKGLAIESFIDPEIPAHLWGDPDRLRQILVNLAGNAVKFTEAGKIGVHVSQTRACETGSCLSFRITDTGIGIEAEMLDRILMPFEQANNSNSRRYGGTGLGLAISKQLIEMMGGGLQVASAPGEGSCFCFTLRLEQAPEEPAAQVAELGADAVAQFGAKVLLVEDNDVNRVIAEAYLTAMGCGFDTATNGFEALSAFDRGAYDLILMDCEMPGMDGFEATAALRRKERATGRSKPVPIIALTAHAFDENRERCRDAGMDDFLSKPFDRQGLHEILARWLVKRKPVGVPRIGGVV